MPKKTLRMAQRRIKRHLPRGYRLVLFGSWANGTATKVSDLDFGITGSKPLPLSVMHQIHEDLETLPTLRKIDIVDLQSVSARFKKNILAYAKRL